MNRYSIPDNAIKGFQIYFNLSEEDSKILNSIYSEIELGDRVSNIIEMGEGRMSLESKDYESMMKSLLSISNSYVESKDSHEKFVKEFSESIVGSDVPYQLSDVEEKLDKVIHGLNKLVITYKARDLQTSNSNNYSTSRIISDIRIVYDSDISNSNQHAIIVHKLKIDTFDGESYKPLYISLGSNDLQSLKDSVDRAIQKDINIRQLYNSFNFIEFKKNT